jgi:virulence factor Mce-like protein
MTTRRQRMLAAMAMSACLSVSGCASHGLASLPLPAPGGLRRGGFELTAIFTNALNLPSRAKVKLGGADIGEVTAMVARNYTAVTTLRIMPGVELPKGSTAELRSATPLGDIFVALKPPSPAQPNAPLLKSGDTIGLESTSAAATVEALLSSAAVVVNGGALRNLTNIINGMGKATGDQGEAFGNLIRKSNHTLERLNARTDQISTALTETSKLVDQMKAKNQELVDVVTAAGPATDTLGANATQIADLVDRVGNVTDLLAKFPSIGGTDTSGRSVLTDLNTISSSFNDVVLDPDATLLALNRLMPPVVKGFSSSAWAVRVSIDRLILGQIPDIGFAGDDGFHGPKWVNFNQLIGSFKYSLLRIRERITGAGPGVPEVPVIPDPAAPGELQVVGPPPGPPETVPPGWAPPAHTGPPLVAPWVAPPPGWAPGQAAPPPPSNALPAEAPQ